MTQTPPDLRAALVQLRDDMQREWLESLDPRSNGFAADMCVPAWIGRLSALLALDHPSGETGWQDIETAPKGSWLEGPDDVRHPDYVRPPHLWLLLPDGQRCVGSADAYYAEGGNGYDGDSYWVEEFSGERVRPVKWQPLPPPPREPQ